MTNESPDEGKQNAKAGRAHRATPRTQRNEKQSSIRVERSGDWMPVEELWQAARAAVEAGHDVTLDLGRIEHLDASALQVLLALDAEQKKLGRRLELINVSPPLRQWFLYAGAVEHFFEDGDRPR
ncbi:MAG: STAS domain-containing protein [Terriglobia bacterium]|jgi:ABC-type transporter Mla MlaB component